MSRSLSVSFLTVLMLSIPSVSMSATRELSPQQIVDHHITQIQIKMQLKKYERILELIADAEISLVLSTLDKHAESIVEIEGRLKVLRDFAENTRGNLTELSQRLPPSHDPLSATSLARGSGK